MISDPSPARRSSKAKALGLRLKREQMVYFPLKAAILIAQLHWNLVWKSSNLLLLVAIMDWLSTQTLMMVKLIGRMDLDLDLDLELHHHAAPSTPTIVKVKF